MINNGDIAAQALGFFEVVRGQNDRGAFIAVNAAHVLPHAAAQFDIDPGSGLVENQQLGSVHQGTRNH